MESPKAGTFIGLPNVSDKSNSYLSLVTIRHVMLLAGVSSGDGVGVGVGARWVVADGVELADVVGDSLSALEAWPAHPDSSRAMSATGPMRVIARRAGFNCFPFFRELSLDAPIGLRV